MMPSKEWKETVPAGEEAELEAQAKVLAEMQARRGGGDRGLHAKGHAGLLARVTVDEGLADYARQGLFARPGTYKAYVRFSNGGPDRKPDRIPDVRGMAVKILGVEGKKVLGDAATQDFLAIDAVKTPVSSPADFVAIVQAVESGKPLRGLIKAFGLGRTLVIGFRAATGIKGNPRDLLDVTFNTVLPVAFGPYAARVAFAPIHAPSPPAGKGAGKDYVGPRIAARGAREVLRWEIRAQFFTGPETPIEDPTINWSSPFVRLGEIETVPVDPDGDKGKALAAFIEKASFDPWHALVEHRPLGAMMRARKHAYFHSTKARAAAPEPDGSEWDGFLPAST